MSIMTNTCSCSKKHRHGHGSARSLVRKIGSSLPISTGKRIYIRVPGIDSPLATGDSEFRYEATGQRYTPNEEGLTLASLIHNPRNLFKTADVFQLESISEEGERRGEVMSPEEEYVVKNDSEKQEAALEKISALESELARLKMQIAMYALTEEETETENEAVIPGPPPPPPPPLPLPATPMAMQMDIGSDPIASTPSHSGGAILSSTTIPGPSHVQSTDLFTTPGHSNMSDVLRDIGSVKLRTVNMAKSPGGTPLRPTNKAGMRTDPNDPASIIAQALRRKFAHKVFRDSPDKNLDHSDASLPPSFDSPTMNSHK